MESQYFSGEWQQSQQNNQKLKSRKRNIWSTEEVRFFLHLVKEKQVVGLMDGKRLRVNDIFKTLAGPMKEQGYIRDPAQLVIKYKNLKAEYYKCKRHNCISGNSPMLFEFFDEMDRILGSRPISQSCESQSGFEIISVINDVELVYEDAPDFDGQVPGISRMKTPDMEISSSGSQINFINTKENNSVNMETPKGVAKKTVKKRTDPAKTLDEHLNKMEQNQREEVQADREFFETLLDRQENIMLKCTKVFLSGLKHIMNNKNDSDDD